MSISVPRKTLSADEVMRRIIRAGNVIDLGSGSLLGGAPSKLTEDEVERSLERLLKRSNDSSGATASQRS